MNYLKRKLALKRQLERVIVLKYKLQELGEKELMASLEKAEKEIYEKDYNVEIEVMDDFTKLHNEIMRRV